jgi:hypothetical protein
MPTLSDSEGVRPKSKCKIVGMQIPEYDHFHYFERFNIDKTDTYGLPASTLFKFKTESRPLIDRY